MDKAVWIIEAVHHYQTHAAYKWIVTYDECDFIRQLYADCRKQIISLAYSAGRTRKGSEFLIFGNLIEIPDANKSAG